MRHCELGVTKGYFEHWNVIIVITSGKHVISVIPVRPYWNSNIWVLFNLNILNVENALLLELYVVYSSIHQSYCEL